MAEFKDGSKKAALTFSEYPDKEWSVNKTNYDNLTDMYGSDPDKWVGKTLKLYSERYKAKDGSSGWTVKVKVSMTRGNAPRPKSAEHYDERNPPPEDDIPF